MHVLRFGNKLNEEVRRGFIFANLFNSLYLLVRLWWNILVANLATNFQDLVAKVKNLVALAPVLGAISRPDIASIVKHNWRKFEKKNYILAIFNLRTNKQPVHLKFNKKKILMIYNLVLKTLSSLKNNQRPIETSIVVLIVNWVNL